MPHIINTLEPLGTDCYKLSFTDGISFFVRLAYLEGVEQERLASGVELTEEEHDALMSAGLAYAAERDAVSFLERSEHSRFLLKAKLLKKNHSPAYIDRALDYCQERNWLSDRRYAGAWLRSRAITHIEGRYRLSGELAARGVGREDASAALDEFFEQESEEEKCIRALERLTEQGKDGDALIRALVRKGFPERMIRKSLKD